ncbi:Prostasin [Frankliniella fusca]|uniref:Prostasin n=1 Tax=Frankliniella fusca TaxID=407009 RepID=A0AAE1H5P4_9NEOP|nr:Prostasin [Frankliniella fusca]
MNFVKFFAVSLCLSLGSTTTLAAFPTECGKALPSGQAVVINGKDANALEFPWHAGLYIKVSQEWTQICGGSLIHQKLVLTAAHCLYEEAKYGRTINAENFKVSFGSPFRDWSRITQYVQRKNVSRTFPHPHYRGLRRNHVDDIALVELSQPVTFTDNVRPVCVDRDGSLLRDGSEGKVVGWGQSALNSETPSPVLQSADMPFIPFDRCLDAVHPDFAQFLSPEKFCAGQINGSAVAPGDSGGGLAFPFDGRWWLSGIVSVGPRNRLSYSAFTRVASHRDWIDSVVKMIEETQELSSLTECREFSNQVYGNSKKSFCGIQRKPKVAGLAGPREFPHMALVGFGNASDIQWTCGGSLISPTFVLSLALCLMHNGDRVEWVLLGDLIRSIESDEAQPQRIAVDEVFMHPMYKPPVQYHNIGLIRLKRPAQLNEFVHPACLHTERSVRESTVIVSGWGSSEFGDAELADHMKRIEMDVVSNEVCEAKYNGLSALSKTRLPEGLRDDLLALEKLACIK